jgi:hypothetical protein
MLDSVRSSIIAATFRVNDRPNAKPNPDASSRDGDGDVRHWSFSASAPGTLDRATVFRAQEPSRFLLEMGLQDTQ